MMLPPNLSGNCRYCHKDLQPAVVDINDSDGLPEPFILGECDSYCIVTLQELFSSSEVF